MGIHVGVEKTIQEPSNMKLIESVGSVVDNAAEMGHLWLADHVADASHIVGDILAQVLVDKKLDPVAKELSIHATNMAVLKH